MSNSSVEESYNKFVQFLYQYITDPIKDFAKIKPRILSILQTHRPIKVIDYQWGISKAGKNKYHLIVHEFAERLKVREYFKTGKNIWYCCECTRTSNASAEQSVGDLLFEHGMVFVKLEHECSPRQLSFVMNVQKLYKDKKMEEANALQKFVLGSEDLNVVTVRKTAVKRKSSAEAAKSALASEKNVHHDAEENAIVQESSIMDHPVRERLPPEEMFAKIVENLKEYTNEKVEEVLSNKSLIFRVLETHFPLKMCEYQYGLTANLRKNRRIIVFEWNDRKRVREYSKQGQKYVWACRECHRICARRTTFSYSYLHTINGIAFIPYGHKCPPRDYELVMQYQKFLEEGDTTKANSMASLVNFTYGVESLANYKNSLDLGNAPNDDITSYNPETTQMKELNLPTASTFVFEKPSISMLEQICIKLKIEYSNRAIKLWDKIMFEQIDSDAIDIDKMEIQKFKTESIYEILSRFFTGSSKQGEKIHATIFEAFREKLISSGKISAKEFDKQYSINDTVVTDRLLSFMAKFIPCRILIIEEKEIRMYGKWKSPGLRKRVTLVLSYFNGFYSVVLNL